MKTSAQAHKVTINGIEFIRGFAFDELLARSYLNPSQVACLGMIDGHWVRKNIAGPIEFLSPELADACNRATKELWR